jgi:hypothetical protein
MASLAVDHRQRFSVQQVVRNILIYPKSYIIWVILTKNYQINYNKQSSIHNKKNNELQD